MIDVIVRQTERCVETVDNGKGKGGDGMRRRDGSKEGILLELGHTESVEISNLSSVNG